MSAGRGIVSESTMANTNYTKFKYKCMNIFETMLLLVILPISISLGLEVGSNFDLKRKNITICTNEAMKIFFWGEGRSQSTKAKPVIPGMTDPGGVF